MTTLDLMRSLQDFAPRSAWHYEDVLPSAPVAESVARLATLDTVSSLDLVASLETAADDIARRTGGAPQTPTAVTLTRAERRKRQARDAARTAPPRPRLTSMRRPRCAASARRPRCWRHRPSRRDMIWCRVGVARGSGWRQ